MMKMGRDSTLTVCLNSKYFQWPLVACILFALGGCKSKAQVQPLDTSLMRLAVDSSGLPRLWADCSTPIVLEVARPRVRDAALEQSLSASIAAWQVKGLPPIELKWGDKRVVQEDGHSTISFVSPSSACASGQASSRACLMGQWRGLTALYGRKAGARNLTIEADIRLNPALLKDKNELKEVLLHEMGHVLGLDHTQVALALEDSIMAAHTPVGSKGPGRLDIAQLRKSYAPYCE